MQTFIRLVMGAFILLLVAASAQSGVFKPIEVNKRTQKERSKDYFEVQVSEGSYGRLNFTVQVKKNPLDAQVTTSLSRIEIIEGGKPIGWIPTQRRDHRDGSGHFVHFELTSELAAKCVLVLVELTNDVSGNVYRIDLFSYTKEGEKQERPLFDELVKIEFPKDGYTYTLNEAAKGIKIEYKIVVERDIKDVVARPYGPSFLEPAGPSGLHPREQISGMGQLYSLLDGGLGRPSEEVLRTLKKGTYLHSFEWDGRNWTGPSDTSNPKGKPFPAGTYEVIVTFQGFWKTDKGNIPYEVSGKTKLTLK